MSIWSKIGLADQKVLSEIQTELLELKEEQARLVTERCDMLGHRLEECDKNTIRQIEAFSGERANSEKYITDLIEAKSRGITEALNSHEEFLKKIYTLDTDRNEMWGEKFQELLRRISPDNAEVVRQISESSQSILNTVNSIQEQHKRLDEQLENMVQLLQSAPDDHAAITEMGLKIKNGEQDIKNISEYILKLWEAMKLVWINELLDEVSPS